MIRLGMIKLGVFLELIDFGTVGVACDESICKAFKVASEKDGALQKKVFPMATSL
jgi:hypothetical protein